MLKTELKPSEQRAYISEATIWSFPSSTQQFGWWRHCEPDLQVSLVRSLPIFYLEAVKWTVVFFFIFISYLSVTRSITTGTDDKSTSKQWTLCILITAGQTEVEDATFGCSFLDLELTLTSALADTILGLYSPLVCSSSSHPLFCPTVPAVLDASIVGIELPRSFRQKLLPTLRIFETWPANAARSFGMPITNQHYLVDLFLTPL